MLTEDYIVRMIRDMGRMLARVLGSDALEPERAVELWTERAGDCPPLLEELKALCDRGTVSYTHLSSSTGRSLLLLQLGHRDTESWHTPRHLVQ